MSQEELDQFYIEPLPTVPSDLEVAMEVVHDKECQDSTQRADQPIPPSRVEETPQGPPGMLPQVTGEAQPSLMEE